MRTNWLRRSLGIAVCVSPLALGLGSIASGLAGYAPGRPAAIGVVVAALCLALMNFYLSFIRPRLSKNSRHVSGIPIIGSLLVIAGLIWGFGCALPAAVGTAAYALDTGGGLWVLIATWKDSSFWDDA